MVDNFNSLHGKPVLSVVIPAFNEGKYLPHNLETLKMQNFPYPFEVIVVDNNSSDKTSDVAKGFGARVVFEKSVGTLRARQKGAESAFADIVVTTDADTVFKEDWLNNIYQAFEKNSSAVMVSGPFRFMPPPKWGAWYSLFLFGLTGLIYGLTGFVFYTPASNSAFKKSVWFGVGGYNFQLTQGGDEFDLSRRLRKKGRVIFLKDNLVYTSSRRLRKGLLYSAFISLFWYYLFDYFIFSKITGRSLVGEFKPEREDDLAASK